MFYIFKKNVYLVKGITRGCIYDFNTKKLYNVNETLVHELEKVNEYGIRTDEVEGELKSVLQQLVLMNILDISEKSITHHIAEIKEKGCECEFAWIEITNKCNLKCIHCYNESGENRDQTMSLNDYKGVIDNLQEMGVKKIQIIGGEPFFYRKLLKKMLDYTVGKFEIIEIFTNGTLITNDWYEYLLNENIRIALSIYSYLANEHNKVTQHQGAWDLE